MIYPVQFSIPECKIVDEIPKKEKLTSHIIPGDMKTYIFNNEKDYYEDYQKSLFGITKKKAGWDCLRHYEILANGSIPYFLELEKCPKNTMILLPKDLLLESRNLYDKYKNMSLTIEDFYREYYDEYKNIMEKLLLHTKQFLSTKAMAQNILNISENTNPTKILFLSGKNKLALKCDYLRCLTLHGFKELFGKNCHDYPCISHLYSDYSRNMNKYLYGKGMTYSKLLDKEKMRDNNLDNNIENDITNKKYDLIIYGSIKRGMPFFDIVNQNYDKKNIILLFGEDKMDHKFPRKFTSQGYNVFVREQS